MKVSPVPAGPAAPVAQPARDPKLWKAACAIEANFLSEMLKYASPEPGPSGEGASSGFSGGIGEDQFASFLRNERAEQLVTAGGIGLAPRIYEAMEKRYGL